MASPVQCAGYDLGYIWSSFPHTAGAKTYRGKRPGAVFVLGAEDCSSWKRINWHGSRVHTSSHTTRNRPHGHPGTSTADRLEGLARATTARVRAVPILIQNPPRNALSLLPSLPPAWCSSGPTSAWYCEKSASREGRMLLPTLRSPQPQQEARHITHKPSTTTKCKRPITIGISSDRGLESQSTGGLDPCLCRDNSSPSGMGSSRHPRA